jgi:hypothetical protein
MIEKMSEDLLVHTNHHFLRIIGNIMGKIVWGK